MCCPKSPVTAEDGSLRVVANVVNDRLLSNLANVVAGLGAYVAHVVRS